MRVPFAKPYFLGHEGEVVADVIATGWVSQGPRVREFEAAFAARVGALDAVATSNCTTALQLSLYVAGVGPGDEVIVPSLSFIATANAAWHCGATPVFADVDPQTFNVTAETIEPLITERTKAIVPVHQIGLPADMDPINALAAKHGIAVIEDAACATGAEYKGKPVGSGANLACFSFHPRKVITTGEGGMITVNDPEVAARLRRLRQHSMDVSDLVRHDAKNVVLESYPERGWNCRMTDMQAAIGILQLEVLDRMLANRKRLAERYNEAFEGHPYIEAPFDPDYAERAWQSYAVRLSTDAPIDRTELMARMLDDGIATRRGVMAIHEEPSYAEGAPSLPHTEDVTHNTLLLPLFPAMTDEELDYVLESIATHLGAVPA
jgi:perosamine synthetase